MGSRAGTSVHVSVHLLQIHRVSLPLEEQTPHTLAAFLSSLDNISSVIHFLFYLGVDKVGPWEGLF